MIYWIFLNGTHVSANNLMSSIYVAKKALLKQYPQLEVFLSNNPSELEGKIKTFKAFNKSQFELTYNSTIVSEIRKSYTIWNAPNVPKLIQRDTI